MKRMKLVLTTVALAFALAGCDAIRSAMPPKPPERPADMSGAVTTIDKTPAAGDVLGSMLVEDPNGTDKAQVTVTAKTTVFVKMTDKTGAATFADLMTGDRVQVWFTGPVAESYPVQGTAEAIVVVP